MHRFGESERRANARAGIGAKEGDGGGQGLPSGLGIKSREELLGDAMRLKSQLSVVKGGKLKKRK